MVEQLQRRLVRMRLVERFDQPNVVLVLVRVCGDLQTQDSHFILLLPLLLLLRSPAAALLHSPWDRDANGSAGNPRQSCDS